MDISTLSTRAHSRNIEAFLSSPRLWLNDGGIETELIYHEGFDLPLFSAFVLLDRPEGRTALSRYFNRYLDLAEKTGRGFMLDTPTWRANMGWGAKLGLSEAEIRSANRKAVALARELQAARPWAERILINGTIGPSGDGYAPEVLLSPSDAEAIHRPQIETLAEEGVDLVTALTMTHPGEAIGVARAARAAGVPVALSFVVDLDGRLPVGISLSKAIAEVDAATDGIVAYFGVNCAHPTHFIGTLSGDWTSRIGMIRANASRKSHAELDVATELDEGDPDDFGALMQDLSTRLPNLRVVGGCCGTDHRHVAAVAARL